MTTLATTADFAAALDACILALIEGWHRGGVAPSEDAFSALALDLFAYQCTKNEPYQRYVASLPQEMQRPRTWRDIPPVPSSAFRDATLATFHVRSAELEFHTSGTTAAVAGRHYVERAVLYEAASLAAFDRFMLPDAARLVYVNLVPNPDTQPHSSLGAMMRIVGRARGADPPGFFLRPDGVDVAGFTAALRRAIERTRPVCIGGTAFAFVAVLDALRARGERFTCASGSRVMETGGFKGRSRIVERDALYDDLSLTFGIPRCAIVAEYGMTELLSQYYDAPASRDASVRVKTGPPWLRALVVDADGRELPQGAVGFLRHVDLANRSSVVAVQTEDRGYATDDGFVLLGRDAEAPPRGCSLGAEELAARRA